MFPSALAQPVRKDIHLARYDRVNILLDITK